MSQFELTEVSQDAARGDVKIVYDAIRSDMGVAVVNLIWRRLATQPEALRFAWPRLPPNAPSNAVQKRLTRDWTTARMTERQTIPATMQPPNNR